MKEIKCDEFREALLNHEHMKVHLIAIGGSAMHNMAIALKEKGYEVTGSDDQIFEPSRSRLKKHGLLPKKEGWNPSSITKDLDVVILGMHARPDNPELKKAQELGLAIYSYPEYIYNQSREKVRVVIAGSHGKTSITAMVLHVLHHYNRDVDYMVGAQLEGFDTMVKLTDEAPVIILEGDEYLSSPIDRKPKFLWYKPHIALISGIAWDHINVFKTYEDYVEQFELFVEDMKDNSTLIYCEIDRELKRITEEKAAKKVNKIPYRTPSHKIINNQTILKTDEGDIPLKVFGNHNLQNLNGARLILNQLNITDEQFYKAIQSFTGAANRLQKLEENDTACIFKDFAHAPSKLKATTAAVKAQYPDRELIAIMELHTFSSLTKEFLKEYKGAMNSADRAIVYYNPKTIEHKKLDPIEKEDVRQAFNREDLSVRTDSEQLENYLRGLSLDNANLLIMTSGNFDGIDVEKLAGEIIHKGEETKAKS